MEKYFWTEKENLLKLEKSSLKKMRKIRLFKWYFNTSTKKCRCKLYKIQQTH